MPCAPAAQQEALDLLALEHGAAVGRAGIGADQGIDADAIGEVSAEAETTEVEALVDELLVLLLTTGPVLAKAALVAMRRARAERTGSFSRAAATSFMPASGSLRISETFKATVVRLPTREEMTQEVNEQLIVEFYSRF